MRVPLRLCPRQLFALSWEDGGFTPCQTSGKALPVPCPSRQLPGRCWSQLTVPCNLLAVLAP